MVDFAAPPSGDQSPPPGPIQGGKGNLWNNDQTTTQEQFVRPYTTCDVTPVKDPKTVEVILYKDNLYTVPVELLKLIDEYLKMKKAAT